MVNAKWKKKTNYLSFTFTSLHVSPSTVPLKIANHIKIPRVQRANNNEETRGLIFHSSILLDTPPRFPFGHCPPTIFNTTPPRAPRACRCLPPPPPLLLLLLVSSSRNDVFERWIRFNGVEPPPVETLTTSWAREKLVNQREETSGVTSW